MRRFNYGRVGLLWFFTSGWILIYDIIQEEKTPLRRINKK